MEFKECIAMFERKSREQNIPNDGSMHETHTRNELAKKEKCNDVQRRITMFEQISAKLLPSGQKEDEKRNRFIEECFADKTKCPFDSRLRRLNETEIDHIIAFCDGVQIQKGRFADDLCGSVYFSLKHLPGLNINVAIKAIQTNGNDNAKTSMKNEEVASILRHFAVVPVFAKYESSDEKRMCFLSAFMINGDLEEVLKDDNARAIRGEVITLSPKFRTKITFQVSKGIAFLHSSKEIKKCILHLDIKSANIFLDPHFNARLGDFGNARELEKPDGDDVKEDDYFGTPGYFPKDKVSTISKNMDYFAFGVTMLELLTGVNPCCVKPYRQIRLYQCQNLEVFIRLLHIANSRLNIDQRAVQANVIYSTLDCSCADLGCIEQTCRDIVLKTQKELMTNIPCGVVVCKSDLCTRCREFKQVIKTRINDLEKLKNELESDNYAHECHSSHPEWLQDLKDQTQLCKCFNETLSRLFKWGKYHKDLAKISLSCLKVFSSHSKFSFQNDVVGKLMEIMRHQNFDYWHKQPSDDKCEICLINPAISGVIDKKMFAHEISCRSHMLVCSECANSHYLNPVGCHSCEDGHPRISGQNTAVICIAGDGEGAAIFLNDAMKVKQAFQDMFNSPDKYHFLIKKNKETYQKQLELAVEWINKNEDISTLIFFYSGHGSPGKLEPSNTEEITEDKFKTFLKSLKRINRVFSYFDCCCPFTIKGSMLKCGSVKSFQYKAATTSTTAESLKDRKQSIFTTLFLQVLKINTEQINCFHEEECKVCTQYKDQLKDNHCYIDSDDIHSYIERHVNQGVNLTPAKATTEGEISKEHRLFVPLNKNFKMQMRLRMHEQNIDGDVKYIDRFACVNPRSDFKDIRIGLLSEFLGEDIGRKLHQYADVLCILSEARNKECFNKNDLFNVWSSKQLVNVSLRKYDKIADGRVGFFIETDEQEQHKNEPVLKHLFDKSFGLRHTSNDNETLTLTCCEFCNSVELGSPLYGLSSYLKQRNDVEQTSITLTVPHNYRKFVCLKWRTP